MKGWKKALLIVLAFIICYIGIMVVAYDYLYKYPTGILDTMEREDGALFYAVTRKEKVNSETLLYFSRSSNGTGTDVHVGTLSSKVPDIISNFFAKSTSSYYIPANTISYGVTSDTREYYLFGATTDMNTVKVVITFMVGESAETYKEYVMNYKSQTYYYWGFDPADADYKCHIVGYNKNDGITFQYYGKPILVGEYTPS